MSCNALRPQYQLDKHITFNGIAHRPEPYQAIISSRPLGGGGSSEPNELSWIRPWLRTFKKTH